MADKPVSDSVATLDADGTVSNARLHEKLTEGVPDEDFRQQTRRELLDMGVPEEHVDRVIKAP